MAAQTQDPQTPRKSQADHDPKAPDPRIHWEEVYQRKEPEAQTWYQRRPDISLELIEQAAAYSGADSPLRIIDVGGGASTLVDHLLDQGHHATVVDLARPALEASQTRLGERAGKVDWIVGDVTEPLTPTEPFDIWHDRAVLHFLRDAADRQGYLSNLSRLLRPGGHVVLATFAPDGPERCSGLPVQRYSPEAMAELLGDDYRLHATRRELHPRPQGGTQAFAYGLFERLL